MKITRDIVIRKALENIGTARYLKGYYEGMIDKEGSGKWRKYYQEKVVVNRESAKTHQDLLEVYLGINQTWNISKSTAKKFIMKGVSS